jgi:hypothetical protein
VDIFPRRRWLDFIRKTQRPAQPFGIKDRALDVAIDRPFFEEDDDFAIRTLPRIAALNSARPVAEAALAPRAANLDAIIHRSIPHSKQPADPLSGRVVVAAYSLNV